MFEFEDRKKLQAIVLELIGSDRGNNELAMILRHQGSKLIDALLDQYSDTDNVSFVGEYLRIFAQYPSLLPSWYDLSKIKRLLQVILNPEFNIQSDAIHTVQVSL